MRERLIVVYLRQNPTQVQLKGWLMADTMRPDGMSPDEADRVLLIEWWLVALNTAVDASTHGAFSWNTLLEDRGRLVANMDAANERADDRDEERPYHHYGAETSREDIWAELGLKVADVDHDAPS